MSELEETKPNTANKLSESERKARMAVLLTRKEVAHRWGVCIHTVARHPTLKPVKFNSRLLRYRLADVERVEMEAAV